jgi:hypothetical protein
VGVAQLVELLVVVQAVGGSSPLAHPPEKAHYQGCIATDISTVVGVRALVSAILVGSTSWWVLTGVSLLTATFNWSGVARERQQLR